MIDAHDGSGNVARATGLGSANGSTGHPVVASEGPSCVKVKYGRDLKERFVPTERAGASPRREVDLVVTVDCSYR
jgi:hypothetical protein